MRTLGSFNRQVNLPSHPNDYVGVAVERPAIKTLQADGYTLGIARNAPLNEGYAPSGGDFTQSKKAPGRPRMAGQSLNISASAAPMIGSAELRAPNIS